MHEDEKKAQDNLERNVRYMTSVLKASDTERSLRKQVRIQREGVDEGVLISFLTRMFRL